MYTAKELVRIAKRENNNKRKYLVLNPLQGKHVPVPPTQAQDMFEALGRLVTEEYQRERLLLIGFAETATAIGAAIAVQTGAYYMQTTRETIEGVHYLFFSEAHSHATEQKLIREDMEAVLPEVDRILFIEDEVTTGNTILNIVALIRREYHECPPFAVASLLNGMNREAMGRYRLEGIPAHYLVKTVHDDYEKVALQAQGDGLYHVINREVDPDYGKYEAETEVLTCRGYRNARRLVTGCDYKAACEALWQQVGKRLQGFDGATILVLGTEEFMYPGLYLGKKLEELGKEVRFHATTRSPIVTSLNPNYPLHTRYDLLSAYDESRATYVYDLASYDLALIVTDAPEREGRGIFSIVDALRAGGTEQIMVVRWCSE